jgi:hypothetical protein
VQHLLHGGNAFTATLLVVFWDGFFLGVVVDARKWGLLIKHIYRLVSVFGKAGDYRGLPFVNGTFPLQNLWSLDFRALCLVWKFCE